MDRPTAAAPARHVPGAASAAQVNRFTGGPIHRSTAAAATFSTIATARTAGTRARSTAAAITAAGDINRGVGIHTQVAKRREINSSAQPAIATHAGARRDHQVVETQRNLGIEPGAARNREIKNLPLRPKRAVQPGDSIGSAAVDQYQPARRR